MVFFRHFIEDRQHIQNVYGTTVETVQGERERGFVEGELLDPVDRHITKYPDPFQTGFVVYSIEDERQRVLDVASGIVLT